MSTIKPPLSKGAYSLWVASTQATDAAQIVDNQLFALSIPADYTHAKARLQYALSRWLLRRAGAELGAEIVPVVGGGFRCEAAYCSLTHSEQMAAVLVAAAPCGVDLQADSPKCLRAAGRFLQAQERAAWLDQVGEEQERISIASALWTAKEAVFKAWGEKNVSFSEEIRLILSPQMPLPREAQTLREGASKSFRLEFSRWEGNYWLCLALSAE